MNATIGSVLKNTIYMFEVETKFILQGSRLWPPDIDDGYLRRVLYHDMNKKDENTKPAIHHLVNGPKANVTHQSHSYIDHVSMMTSGLLEHNLIQSFL
ncbi:unnamed protein product [Adineta ricciae]|uniref:Uncharacterized protein n=1 Tax=Adineta ricciae TaxID=249248 RepID=A0A813TJD1_ADIRI|nr:unnamed protein product [Adineta ricciae]